MTSVKSTLFLILTLICVGIFSSYAHASVDVNDIRFGQHENNKVRIVVETSAPTKLKTSLLSSPNRLVLDMSFFEWRVGTVETPKFTGINAVRHGQLETGGRIVLEFGHPIEILTSFAIPANAQNKSHRLIIDYKKAVGTPKTTAQPKTITQTIKPSVPEPKPQIKNAYKPLVVIDPGHGGIDPGAVGKGNVLEKNITLQISRKLKSKLEATGKFRVKLTRNSDIYLKLHRRVRIAREAEADLFISVHADSLEDSSVRGSSVYTLSDKASDAQTARLAKRENRVDLIGGVDIHDEDEDIAGILIDLTTRDTLNQSKFFANTVVKQYGHFGVRSLKRAHRYAGFAVLKAPDIPSVLIECGFLSNAQEAKLLTQAGHQEKITNLLTRGIEIYFQEVSLSE